MNANVLKKGCVLAVGILSAVFTVVPEEYFQYGIVSCNWSDATIVLTNRLFFCAVVIILACVGNFCYLKLRKAVTISDRTFSIKIEYKDLFEVNNGKKVINFDECFSVNVGSKPEDIKPGSVCGQYLVKHPVDDMQSLIHESGIQSYGISIYKNKPKYISGTIIPKDEFFLMAFAKLDENGLGKMS